MANKDLLIINYEHETPISLEEICEICQVPSDIIENFISYAIIQPSGDKNRWLFTMHDLKRLRIALRLQRDLELNLQGVGMVLELVDEMERMRVRMDLLERHFLNL